MFHAPTSSYAGEFAAPIGDTVTRRALSVFGPWRPAAIRTREPLSWEVPFRCDGLPSSFACLHWPADLPKVCPTVWLDGALRWTTTQVQGREFGITGGHRYVKLKSRGARLPAAGLAGQQAAKDSEKQGKIDQARAMQQLKTEGMATKRFPRAYGGDIGLVATAFKGDPKLLVGDDAFWRSAVTRYVFAGRRIATLNLAADVDPRHQDKIAKLARDGMSAEAILYAVTNEGLEIDLDGVLSVIGAQVFGDGRDAPIVDDDEADLAREKEALNTNTGHGPPSRVIPPTYGKKPRNVRLAALYVPYERPWRRIYWPAISWARDGADAVVDDCVSEVVDDCVAAAIPPSIEEDGGWWNGGIVDARSVASRPTRFVFGSCTMRDSDGTGRPWTEINPIVWGSAAKLGWPHKYGAIKTDPKLKIERGADRIELDRIANRVYGSAGRRRSLAEPYDDGEDEWATVIRNFAYGEGRVFMSEVGRHVSRKFGLDKFGRREEGRVAAIFISMGWERIRTKSGSGFRPAEVVTL
jgi:hypothetical protein